MRITKKTREEAIFLLELCLSQDTGFQVLEEIAHSQAAEDLAALAYDAAFPTECEDTHAEAASLLREGWVPGKKWHVFRVDRPCPHSEDFHFVRAGDEGKLRCTECPQWWRHDGYGRTPACPPRGFETCSPVLSRCPDHLVPIEAGKCWVCEHNQKTKRFFKVA